jgi:hypothetical protein
VGLTAYRGAAKQHWSFTDHQGVHMKFGPNRDAFPRIRKNDQRFRKVTLQNMNHRGPHSAHVYSKGL